MNGSGERVWLKSSYSGSDGDACVEVAKGAEAVRVRDSKDAHSPELALPPAAWAEFVSFAVER